MIEVRNALRIQEGDIILIPGGEPTTAATALDNYYYNPYIETIWSNRPPSPYIRLKTALELIPGSYVRFLGPSIANRYFVLPDGPPPPQLCPCGVMTDWYGILLAHADGPGTNADYIHKNNKHDLGDICAAFDYKFCV